MLKKLTDYLDSNSVKYIVTTHSPAYTATEVADSTHVPRNDVAKTVMLEMDGKLCMSVLPSSYMVDFKLLRRELSAGDVELASEGDFKTAFPDCDVGAMPPFGNLFGINVVVDKTLAGNHDILFNAGNHRETVRMAYPDFERLVKPRVCSFGVRRNIRGDEFDVPS